MTERNGLVVRSTREALKAILELSRELREIEEPPGQNLSFAKDGRNYAFSPSRALDEAEAYALHFLRSNLLTHGGAAEAAAGLLQPAVQGVLQAHRNAAQCLSQPRGAPRWNSCGPSFIQEIGPNLTELRENLPLALLKSPPIEEFEEAARSLGGLVEHLEGLKDQAAELAKVVEGLAREAENQQKNAEEAAQTAETFKEQAESARERIHEILEEAKSLEDAIKGFKEEFDALSEDHKVLLKQLKERENELASLLSSPVSKRKRRAKSLPPLKRL